MGKKLTPVPIKASRPCPWSWRPPEVNALFEFEPSELILHISLVLRRLHEVLDVTKVLTVRVLTHESANKCIRRRESATVLRQDHDGARVK
jgi:hypothetical protein